MSAYSKTDGRVSLRLAPEARELANAVRARTEPHRETAVEVLKGVTFTRANVRSEHDDEPMPVLLCDRPVFYPTSSGRLAAVKTAGLITRTSKMAAGSFSLPAGQGVSHGCCNASGQSPAEGKEKLFICYGCYATKSYYTIYTGVAIRQMIRRAWVTHHVEAGTFVDEMVAVLKQWRKGQRWWVEGAKEAKKKNREPLRVLQDKRYFRIHDAGDFAWLPGYYEAWCEIARRMHMVKFWAPTRDWVFTGIDAGLSKQPTVNKSFAAAIRNPSLRPDNLIVRPSALHFGDNPPEVPWLDGGTTSTRWINHKVVDPKKVWLVGGNNIKGWCGVSSNKLCRCPAYTTPEANCAAAGCRTCWTRPDRQVAYPRH